MASGPGVDKADESCLASSNNAIQSVKSKFRVTDLMRSMYTRCSGSSPYCAESLLWTVLPVHFLSFFGVNESGSLDALDTLVASAATLLVLVLSGAIFFHFNEKEARWMAVDLCYLWMITGLLLTATNFVFWNINGFDQWPHSAAIIGRSVPIEPVFSLSIIYLFVSLLSFSIVILASIFGPRKIKMNQEYVRSLAFLSFFVTLVNLANVSFLNIPQ